MARAQRMVARAKVPIASALLVSSVIASPGGVSAHQDSRPAPNGSSPWHYSESWAITGSWYNEGLHNDYVSGQHYNDANAIDFSIPGDGCNKRLYAVYNGMRVTDVRPGEGMLEMQATIGGERYRVRYRHMSSIAVPVGATVGTNTIVGYSGNRGISSGCHLHLSVHRFSDGWWRSIPPTFCGRQYPHDHATRWKGG